MKFGEWACNGAMVMWTNNKCIKRDHHKKYYIYDIGLENKRREKDIHRITESSSSSWDEEQKNINLFCCFIFPSFRSPQYLTEHIKSMLDMTVITPITSFSALTLQTFPFCGETFFCCRRVFFRFGFSLLISPDLSSNVLLW